MPTAPMHVHARAVCTHTRPLCMCMREQCADTHSTYACAYEGSVHTPTAPMRVHARAVCTRPRHLCMCIREQCAHAHSTYACAYESSVHTPTAPMHEHARAACTCPQHPCMRMRDLCVCMREQNAHAHRLTHAGVGTACTCPWHLYLRTRGQHACAPGTHARVCGYTVHATWPIMHVHVSTPCACSQPLCACESRARIRTAPACARKGEAKHMPFITMPTAFPAEAAAPPAVSPVGDSSCGKEASTLSLKNAAPRVLRPPNVGRTSTAVDWYTVGLTGTAP